MSTQSILWTAAMFMFWFLLSYYFHGVGITLGYHRLLTHRSLKLPAWLGYFWVAAGYLALMGSPLVWVGVHRLHHQKSDVDGDPHSPIHGFKHALYGWMFHMAEIQSDAELQAQVPDLMKDPIYRFLGVDHSPRQAQLCLAVNIAYRVILYLVAGPVAVVANVLATFFVFWSPQLVNAVCHVESMGYRSHDTRDLSRNVWWVGLIAVGEGWHNNHHAFPKSAQHGMQWFEVDVTWYTIWVLEKLGLATNVIRPSLTANKALERKAGITMPSLELPEPMPERAWDP
jgi:stearoyl-CoA desaturase (delta-9 desaturase)